MPLHSSIFVLAFALVHLCLTVLLLWVVATYVMPYHFFFPSATRHEAVPGVVQLLLHSITGFSSDAQRVHRDAAAADERNAAVLASATLFHAVMAVATYVVVTRVINPPYGRYAADTLLKLALPARLSWVLQECPTILNVLYHVLLEYPAYASSSHNGGSLPPKNYGTLVAEAAARFHLPIMLFVMHYVHRSFMYPLAVSSRANHVPVHVTWSATLYCLLNGRLQVLANLATFASSPVGGAHDFTAARCLLLTALSPRPYAAAAAAAAAIVAALFVVGSLMFFGGMYVNMTADYHLVSLRERGSGRAVAGARGGYRIPYGGWFDRVSCPNFLGEMVEWSGYALTVFACTWYSSMDDDCVPSVPFSWWTREAWTQPRALPTLAAGSFVVYVLSNLVPRGAAHHAWYLRQFGEEYKRLDRTAVFPRRLWG